MVQVFVYGTLKEGFANFGINAGRRVPGVFRTVERYPLFIIGEHFTPWLAHQPGVGEQVVGQLFEVDAQVLRDMDRLEQVDEPGWYTRTEIQVQALEVPGQAPVSAFVYFGSSERLLTEVVQAGPLAEFTAQHNRDYRHPPA